MTRRRRRLPSLPRGGHRAGFPRRLLQRGQLHRPALPLRFPPKTLRGELRALHLETLDALALPASCGYEVRALLRELESLLDGLGADLYELGAVMRDQQGRGLALAGDKAPTPTALGVAVEAMPDAPEDVRREWAVLFDVEYTSRERRHELLRRFVSART